MNIIQDDNIYTIIEFQHVKPGKGAAFVRTKLRGLENDKNIDKTFRSGESVESVRVERHSYQFLYREGDMFVFMHQQTYEQIMLEERRVMAKEYLSDGEICVGFSRRRAR
jgi:Translation elongation factor P (EF-P)/translation initiation factor 5A (eIF-5A)